MEVASSGQASSGGVLETRSVVFSGKHFFVNMATKPGGKGSVSVAVLDGSGAPIAPFTHQNCAPVTKDSVRQGVTWSGAADLSSVAGKPTTSKLARSIEENTCSSQRLGCMPSWLKPGPLSVYPHAKSTINMRPAEDT